MLALRAGVTGEREFAFVPALGGDHGVGDAGVAAGGVDDDLVAREHPAAFAVEDHRHRRAVLHAAAGVVPFRLGADAHAGREVLPDAFERQQRRVADQIEDRLPDSWCRSFPQNGTHLQLLAMLQGYRRSIQLPTYLA